MSDGTLERLIERFARAAARHHQAMEAMDEGEAHRQAAMISTLFTGIAAQDGGRDALVVLMKHHDPAVAGMAAVYSLRHATGASLTQLRTLAAEPGLLGYRAGMALERWERGEWDLDRE